MKLTKAEKIWLAAVVIFYFLYNLPFFPKYYMPKAAIVHMVVTIIPLWVAIYIGFFKICRGKKEKNTNSATSKNAAKTDENESVCGLETTTKKEDTSC